jgi:hypothetical protein
MSMSLRRAVIFGAPLLAYIAGMLHPDHVLDHGDPWRFLGVHLAWPLLACLLAWMIVLLVDGIDDAAATAARILAVPFAVAYTLYTAYAGIGIGAFIWKGSELPSAQQPIAAALIASVTHSSISSPIHWTAVALWFAAVLAVLVALRRTAPWPALALIAVGAFVFGYRHERPWGPGGMAAVLAGVVLLELRPARTAESTLLKGLRLGR